MKTNVLDHLDLTNEERSFIESACTAHTADMNQSRVVSEFYFVKTLEKSIDKMIVSNAKLADANDRQARIVNGLTWALTFFAAVEAFSTLISALTALGIIGK